MDYMKCEECGEISDDFRPRFADYDGPDICPSCRSCDSMKEIEEGEEGLIE